jgi:hypothetical protein
MTRIAATGTGTTAVETGTMQDPTAVQDIATTAVPDPHMLQGGVDPLARFASLFPLHPLAGDAQGVAMFADGSRAQAGGQQAGPARNTPVLQTRDDEVARPQAQKNAGPLAYDVSKVSQAEIDALKAYPNGMTQADVDKLTRYDISQATIDAMKKSGKPAVRADGERLDNNRQQGAALEARHRLGVTIENARTTYAGMLSMQPPAVIKAVMSAGNGGQPVLVLVNPYFDHSKPARHVHTHYHGDNATVADRQGSKAGTFARLIDQFNREPQSVWVLPESVARPNKKDEWPQQPDSAKHDTSYKASWDNVVSQTQTTRDALNAVGVSDQGAKHVVSAHSRGGSALDRVMAHDPTGAGLKADRLELHDSLYGSQFAVAQWGATANGKAAARVVFYRGWNDDNAGDVIKQAFRSPRGTPPRYEKIDVSQKLAEMRKKDPGVEDKVNPQYTDGTTTDYTRTVQVKGRDGKYHPVQVPLRQFDPDPHYRTTGQFLDKEPGP